MKTKIKFQGQWHYLPLASFRLAPVKTHKPKLPLPTGAFGIIGTTFAKMCQVDRCVLFQNQIVMK